MVPPHQSLLPPSRTRHGCTEFKNVHFTHSHPVRTRPSIADLDEESETLPVDQSRSRSDHDDNTENNNNLQREREREDEKEEEEEGGGSCGACHKPLTLLVGIQSTTLCYICNKLPSTYFCAPCSNGLINFFDGRCSKLPKEIHYPYHPHPLTMGIRKSSNCCVCGQSCGAFNYGCDGGCSFIVDIKCLLKQKKKYDGPITTVTNFMGLLYDL